MGAREQQSRHSELLQRSRGRRNCEDKVWKRSSPNADVPAGKELCAGLSVKLSDGMTTSTALCLIRSAFSKDGPDKVVTRSSRSANPSRAGSNYRLH